VVRGGPARLAALALVFAAAPIAWQVIAASPQPAAPMTVTLAPQLTIVAPAQQVAATATATPTPTIALASTADVAPQLACPPPRSDADWVDPRLPEPVDAVAPAQTNAGWIAAWNAEHVFVSYDAGATFAGALDGEGQVSLAGFDCYGRLVVTRGTRRTVLRCRLALSHDGGATWTYRDLATSGQPTTRWSGREYEDGRLEVAAVFEDCMSDDVRWISVRGDEVSEITTGIREGSTFALVGDTLVASHGWEHAGGDPHPCGLDVDGEIEVVPGAVPVLLAGGAAYRFKSGAPHRVSLVVEGTPQAIDLQRHQRRRVSVAGRARFTP
jgi:hypothetical protein